MPIRPTKELLCWAKRRRLGHNNQQKNVILLVLFGRKFSFQQQKIIDSFLKELILLYGILE